jgi:hypothetical protein
MKKSLVTAVLLAGAVAIPSVATASASTTTTSKLAKFTYSSASHSGKLKVTHAGRSLTYRVVKASACGYSKGQMGNEIACKSLGKAKYAGKPVRVVWHHDAAGHRIVEVASLDLR